MSVMFDCVYDMYDCTAVILGLATKTFYVLQHGICCCTGYQLALVAQLSITSCNMSNTVGSMSVTMAILAQQSFLIANKLP